MIIHIYLYRKYRLGLWVFSLLNNFFFLKELSFVPKSRSGLCSVVTDTTVKISANYFYNFFIVFYF